MFYYPGVKPKWARAFVCPWIVGMRLRLYRYTFILFCLVALILPGAKLSGLVEWPWLVIAAPLWLILVFALFAWGALTALLYPRLPR